MKKVLLSAVGTADPMTYTGDGPILHIVRHYQPEKVVLMATPDFADKAFNVAEAIGLLNPDLEVEIEQIESMPHEYVFIGTFRQYLTDLALSEPETELLVNVSSGTPAMSSAFVAVHAFGVPNTTAIQVVAPGGIAKREILPNGKWDQNPDNQSARPSRCQVIPSDHFAVLLQRENIKNHIRKFNYGAAAELSKAASLPSSTSAMLQDAKSIENLTKQVATPLEKFQMAVLATQAAKLRGDFNYFVLLATAVTEELIRFRLQEQGVLGEAERAARRDNKDYVTLGELFKNPVSRGILRDIFGAETTGALENLLDARNTPAHKIQAVSNTWLTENHKITAGKIQSMLEKNVGVNPKHFNELNTILMAEIDQSPLT